MLPAARRAGRRRHGRLPRSVAGGGDRLRRHACRRRRTASSPSSKSRRIRRRCRASRTSRCAAWASTCSRPSSCSSSCKRDAADPNSAHDFGKDIIPYLVANGKAVAHHFSQSCVRSTEEAQLYWRDVGTVDAYWAANIDLTDIVPDLDLYDRAWPIWTYGEITPPAKFVHDVDGRRGVAVSSLVSGGCIVSGAAICALAAVHRRARPFLFDGPRGGDPALCRDRPRRARSSKVVIDRGVIIPDGLVVGEDPNSTPSASAAPRTA